MSGPCNLIADEKCTKPHVQTETHFLSDPKPAKTSLEMKHDMRKTHYSRRCNRGNVTPHQPYTKTQRLLPTENVPRQNILDRCGQQHKYKRRNATHKFWGKGHHVNFEWMRPQQSPPKPSGPQVKAPIGHGCLTQSHHQHGNKHTRTQKMMICDTKKIKLWPLVPCFN